MCSASGTAAVTFAIAAPAMFAAVGVATDMAVFSMKRTQLQAVADQAAIAAANELVVGNKDQQTISATVEAYKSAALHDPSRDVVPQASLADDAASVTVELTETWTPFFAHFLGVDVTPITTSATATLAGESKICVLATSTSGVGAVSMTKTSYLQANGCSVYSNSASSMGVYLGDSSMIESPLVCSAGGVYGKGKLSGTNALTDCLPIADPLAGRPVPVYGGCDYNKYKVSSGSVTLKPGVYCGGMDIFGTANVTFAPGEYIIKDGFFRIKDNAIASGKDVAFYLTGLASTVWFLGNATIDFSGAETGTMAGLLFFEDPKSSPFRMHRISASGAHTLTGTIYLPAGNLMVDPNSNVGQNSAYTAIVARRLIVENGPRLVLNSDYAATKVPVPAGISSSAQVILSE